MDDTSASTFACGPSAAEAGGILTIDLSAIVANWQMLRKQTIPAECAAVVKADAYGCGLEPVVAALRDAGCRIFFTAHLSEARRARKIAPDADIYVLNGLPPGTPAVFVEHNLRPVIGSALELAEWDAYRALSGQDAKFALHVDTGMNRLGMSMAEAIAVAPRLQSERHDIALLMSHFVAAEVEGHPRNSEQASAFRELRRAFRGVPASLANSSGSFLGDTYSHDIVRPGVALYGVNPTPDKPNPMRRVVELKVRVIQVRMIEFGETVGYNAVWTARRRSRIATLDVGYADGFFRAASASDNRPGGFVVIAGKRCPIAGRVSMDLTTVDVTDLDEGAVRRGDFATLIGETITLEDVAEFFNTNAYEVLTSLGARYARLYRR